MDQFDLLTNQQIEEFNRNLDTMASSYQRQAYVAGLTQAKAVWDAMHTQPQSDRSHAQLSVLLVLVIATTALAITVGAGMYFLIIHPFSSPPPVSQPRSLYDWLILVK